MHHDRHGFSDRNPEDNSESLKIVLIDDSNVVRAVLERILSASPKFTVVASAASAQEAMAYLAKNEADIIILDIEMPTGNGLDAMPELLAISDARILVLSSLAEPGGVAAVRALTLGACDTLAKPGRSSFGGQFATILHDKLVGLGRSVARELVPAGPVIMRDYDYSNNVVDCIAIGSSTGGIPAMQEFFAALDAHIDVPIFLTQHLPASFLPFLVSQLGEVVSRKVFLAQDGQRCEHGYIYIAPSSGHLQITGNGKDKKIQICPETNGRYMPSVDPMFSSVAKHYGKNAIAIVLSGMGRDGLLGTEEIAERGGHVYAQDPASSVVWGMPGVVSRSGLASAILPPADIGQHISDHYVTSKSLESAA
jgi:two-component system chemotaxis response regulator CheB